MAELVRERRMTGEGSAFKTQRERFDDSDQTRGGKRRVGNKSQTLDTFWLLARSRNANVLAYLGRLSDETQCHVIILRSMG